MRSKFRGDKIAFPEHTFPVDFIKGLQPHTYLSDSFIALTVRNHGAVMAPIPCAIGSQPLPNSARDDACATRHLDDDCTRHAPLQNLRSCSDECERTCTCSRHARRGLGLMRSLVFGMPLASRCQEVEKKQPWNEHFWQTTETSTPQSQTPFSSIISTTSILDNARDVVFTFHIKAKSSEAMSSFKTFREGLSCNPPPIASFNRAHGPPP
jgi:hypothetical protein